MPEVRKLWQTEGLFSDHYLKARLKDNEWWPTDATAQPIWQFCKELYEKRAFALRRFDNEMGVRQEFVNKILERLGFTWSDNLRLPETKQDLEPDYILYPDAETKERVLNKSVTERYRVGVALLEAKKFGHSLSQISRRQQRYPHQQIREYLRESTTIVWGILTNGEVWRLYCRESKASEFFALNFEVALKSLEDFKVFVALFSPPALTRDAQDRCRLDNVRESSLATQSRLEEDLRQRIFPIVEMLANGFAEPSEYKITDAQLPRLYESCLIFLYRLLFILYAEGRELLPVEPKSRKYYKELSLARLRAPLKNFSEFDSRTRTRLHQDIQELCHLINGTDAKKNSEYKVPRYNGGLFDPARYPDLEKWRVCDAVLAEVLRGLLFNPLPDPQQPALPVDTVDFGDLRVQQLGSIYEGLLEYHFVRENGRLTLKTDKAERKATGTYYTPDYIVKYIVEQTVAPLLEQIENRETVKSSRAAGTHDNSFANEVLKLNLCDPAMGSGHFLVEATVFLADHIVYHPTTRPATEQVVTKGDRRRTAEEITKAGRIPVPEGESQEQAEIACWRRRVVEGCIYGVDLNPLAVELAKLSLWLTTIATDQPLNFLDHHLCCGNSLIGARLEDLDRVPDKKRKTPDSLRLSWKITENLRAALTQAVSMVHNIESAASASISDVKNKEKLWLQSIRPALLPFRTVANLWTACFFGNDLPQQDYEALIELLDIHPDKIRPWQSSEEFQTIVTEAVKKGSLKLAGREFDINQLKNLCSFLFRSERNAGERRFFHWELEFAEVFFNDDGTSREQPGFDAVIGNPPYDVLSEKEQQREVEADKTFYECSEIFSAAVGSKINLYRLFVSAAVRLLGNGGRHGFIVPMALLGDSQAKPLRHEMLQNWSLKQVEAFPQKDDPRDRVFFGAKLSTCVYILERAMPKSFFVRVHPGKDILESSPRLEMTLKDLENFDAENLSVPCYPNATDADFRLAIKLVAACGGTKLAEFAPSQQGEVNLTTHANFLSDEPVGPIALRGANVGRFIFNDEPKQGEPKYLFVDRFLKAHGPNTKAFDHQFIRIGYQRGAAIDNWRRIIATIIEAENFCSDTVNYIARPKGVDLFTILALLNSSLWEWRFRLTSTNNHVNAYEIDRMPFPRFAFGTSNKERASLLIRAKQLCQRSLADRSSESVLACVLEQLAAKPERADVVHDLLAFLAERMTALNRTKRATAKQFLTDLKDFHGIDARALNPKTKLDQFWKLEAADVFGHLKKNAKTLTTQNVRLTETDEEKIRARFQKAKDKLLPLEGQISFTDRLIDQVVYRLYGLTEEEARLVDESFKK